MEDTPDRPRVSVIIPTWNRANTLLAAVQSALQQRVASLEVLVCDDGSTDDSEARVGALGDHRVRWLPGPHVGQPAAPRNRGLAASRGAWIAFLDSDDRWHPDKLSSQLAAVERLGVLAVCSNALRCPPKQDAGEPMYAHIHDRIPFARLARENLVICSSAMIHRRLLAKVGRFPEDPALIALEDYALWLRVATYTDFAYVAAPLVFYTDSPTSVRSGDDRDSQVQRRSVYRNYLAWSRPLTSQTLTLHRELTSVALTTAWEQTCTVLRFIRRFPRRLKRAD